MIGTHQNPGLYALAARDIFRQLEVSQPRRHLFVWISFYEIYCGQLYDLLNRRKRYGYEWETVNLFFILLSQSPTEASILWSPDAKSQLIGKDPDAGKD